MDARSDRVQGLIAKIRDLPDGRVAEVEDFVDFLRARDEQRELVHAPTSLSEPSLAAVWDNPEDDVYNTEQPGTGAASADRKQTKRRSEEPMLGLELSHGEAAMPTEHLAGVARLNQVYEQYVKPVEQEHLGEYVLVTADGQMIFAPSMETFLERTAHIAPGDNCLFKVGPISAFSVQ